MRGTGGEMSLDRREPGSGLGGLEELESAPAADALLLDRGEMDCPPHRPAIGAARRAGEHACHGPDLPATGQPKTGRGLTP